MRRKNVSAAPSITFLAFILLRGLGASTVALGDVAADGRVGKIVGRLLLDQQQRHFALPERGGTREWVRPRVLRVERW